MALTTRVVQVAAGCMIVGACDHVGGLRARPAPTAIRDILLFDQGRDRLIPVRLYGAATRMEARPVALISHGYGGHNGDYAFIATHLVAKGYQVASIEHREQPGDPPMATSGDLAIARRPTWQIGADSIRFVLKTLAGDARESASKPTLIIGHSNGGDMSMLFAAEHPAEATMAISLDNRRMPLPRSSHPRICSLRSSDQAPDPGVLPTSVEAARFGIMVLPVAVAHDDMWDGATAGQKETMLRAIDICLAAGANLASAAGVKR